MASNDSNANVFLHVVYNLCLYVTWDYILETKKQFSDKEG